MSDPLEQLEHQAEPPVPSQSDTIAYSSHPLSPLRPAPFRFPDLTWVLMIIAGVSIAAVIIDRPALDYTVNDASRWNTVYMLTEHGTYRYKANHQAKFRAGQKFFESVPATMPADELNQLVRDGKLIAITDDGMTKYFHTFDTPPKPGDIMYFPPFATIDMVKLGDNYYSSKPPLLPTLAAAIVWATERISNDTFGANPWLMMRTVLIVLQVIPFMAFIWVVGRYVRRMTDSWYVHAACVAIAAFATYLTPWAVTFNNHVIAAYSAMVALYAVTEIWYAHRREWYLFAVAGFFAAFAAANEMPAALLLAAVLLAMFIKSPRQAILLGVIPALLPIAAFFVTNHIATGQWTPVQSQFEQNPGPYHYPGSYWNNPQDVDALHEPNGIYLMHILVGHHGFFLLTPILLVSLLGIGAQLSFRSHSRPLLAFFVVAATAIVVCFYTFITKESKNYGGAPQGPRWLFWLIPLWLTMLPPGVAIMARSKISRAVLCLLLAVSVFSAGYALRQPWGTNWAHLLFRQFKWIDY